MQSSQPGGGPTVLRCPNCGAPIEAQPFAPTTRCGYCHQTVVLAPPVVQRPPYPHPAAPAARPVGSVSSRTPVLVFVVALTVTGSVAAFLASQSASPPPVAKPAAVAVAKPAQLTEPRAQPRAPTKTPEVRYPMAALLRIDPTVDIDGSKAHLAALFPGVAGERLAGDLGYTVPLDHPWFREAVLNWKNEKNGRLATVGFRPPLGDDKLKNQAEIRDCLAKALGKPVAREVDHLAGEYSYFWGSHFPKVWANLYSSYLWMAFEDPRGVAPVTLPTVVRTLAGCAGPKP